MAPAPKTAPKAKQNGQPDAEPWLALPLSVLQDIEEVLTQEALNGQRAERTLNKIRQHIAPAQQED